MVLKLLCGVLRFNDKEATADGRDQVLTVAEKGLPKAGQGSQKDPCTDGSESRAPVKTHSQFEPTKHRASRRVAAIEGGKRRSPVLEPPTGICQ